MDTASAAAAPTCWSCGLDLSTTALFCHGCGVVLPPGQVDHFARLGFERSFDVDPKALDGRYFGLQRRLHPDRFARKPPRERVVSQSHAAALNEAYETLRHPLRRARYLAALVGVDLPGDGRTIDDPELLMEAMDAREALAEASTPERVERLAAGARDELARGVAALGPLFERGDKPALRKAILRLAYLDKFAEEARARRLNLEPTRI
ncbi:MAG: Fe-S protein assembly co-chaperone HscB [Rhodospirillales bacterium]|nr:Fe-S protein assembly co-chaperone HscB [Rhodospirillales bacterium]QQS12834.1 MAG: Fe-S protein assembly co-chaperone HscB [Rhodospirillales bacterium]